MSERGPAAGKTCAVVVANGEFLHPARLLALVDAAQIVIAADGGANWLAQYGRTPRVLVGDMDSVAPDVLRALESGHCRLLRHRPDKDETDTELALLEAHALGASKITIIGALGGRIDHTLGNILLLAMPQLVGTEASIFDGTSSLFLARKEITVYGEVGDVVSLLPLAGDVEGIVADGFQYPLRDETLYFGPARGVSNVLLQAEGRISLRKGMLLIVHSPRRYLEAKP